MNFDWKEYLEVAKYLIDQKSCPFSSEAACRSAVSRAYYAAFCFARNYAEKNHKYVPTGDAQDHAVLRDHFKGMNMWTISERLLKLSQFRSKCDYDNYIVPKNINLMVRSAIIFSEEILYNLK